MNYYLTGHGTKMVFIYSNFAPKSMTDLTGLAG
jgi:hypothetical protein